MTHQGLNQNQAQRNPEAQDVFSSAEADNGEKWLLNPAI